MRGNDELFWLEHSGVWARVPQRDLRSHDGPNKRRKYGDRRKTSPKRYSDNNAGDVVSCREAEGISCSICLDEVKTDHKAVITPCMHEYHHTCIAKWLTMKQECPLCKSQVHTLLYNIENDGSFLEREMDLPLKHDTNREDIMRRLADILGEGLVDLVRYQIGRREQQTGSRNTSGNRHNRNRYGGPSTAAGPTPYSMRVQHHANSRRNEVSTPTSRSNFENYYSSSSGRGGQEDEEALIAWRREIYDLELYAIPLGTHHHIPRSLAAPAGRHNRIKEWVHRELHALLETEHTTILRGFVLGLLSTYGAHPPLPPSRLPPPEILSLHYGDAAGREGTRAEEEVVVPVPGGGDDNPVSQLRPFLGAAAGHFWHELSCFATAPAYTIRTYDNIVRYARPGEPPLRRREDRNREERIEREPRGRTNHRRRRQRSHSRSRSRSRASRDRHYSRTRRRDEVEKQEEEEEEYQRGHFGEQRPERPDRRRDVEAEQPEDARWKMWQWGDPVYE